MWLEVICLTNSEIAGSPRNIFRYSLRLNLTGVEHWMDSALARAQVQTNSEYCKLLPRSQSDPAKRSGPEGNIPDLKLRSLNVPSTFFFEKGAGSRILLVKVRDKLSVKGSLYP